MPKTYTIEIDGMHCKGCALGVQSALEKLPQVESAEASYPDRSAIVSIKDDILDEVAIRQAVKAAGFAVTAIR